jgi:DNA-binding NarL/FixJ family response regulator
MLLSEAQPQAKPETASAIAKTTAAIDAKPGSKKHNSGKRRTKIPTDEEGPAAKPTLKVQIAEMTAQGFSPQKIASKLHLSLAEVDLALNLLNRQTKP